MHRRARSPKYLRLVGGIFRSAFTAWQLRLQSHETCINNCNCLFNVTARCIGTIAENELLVSEYASSLNDACSLLDALQASAGNAQELANPSVTVNGVEETILEVSAMLPNILESRTGSIEFCISCLCARLPLEYSEGARAYFLHFTSHWPQSTTHLVICTLEMIMMEDALSRAVSLLREIDHTLVIEEPAFVDIFEATAVVPAR